MPQTIMLDLPDEIIVRYRKGAAAARKPLEEFLVERLNETAPAYAAEIGAGHLDIDSGEPERPTDKELDRWSEAPALPRTESELLQRINIGFNEEEWAAYHTLVAKRRAGALQPNEQQRLIQFTDRLEQANARRIQALVELAQLRQTTLDALMDDLGIRSPGYE